MTAHHVKLARTIADLAGCEETQSAHLTEALHSYQHCNKHSVAQVSQPSEVDNELAID